ncbi:unnamed protein product [Malus baccata var. baccata]
MTPLSGNGGVRFPGGQKQRVTIVVARRLTTIKNTDAIAVVKNGVAAAKGSHEFLMKIGDGACASFVALHTSSM